MSWRRLMAAILVGTLIPVAIQAADDAAAEAADDGLVEMKLELPKPVFIGTPKNIPPGTTVELKKKPRPPFIHVPEGTENVALDAAVTASDEQASKKGTSSCTSVLMMFAVGDCSVETAAKDGGITEIHHVDWDAKNFLGLYGSYKLTVYGN